MRYLYTCLLCCVSGAPGRRREGPWWSWVESWNIKSCTFKKNLKWVWEGSEGSASSEVQKLDVVLPGVQFWELLYKRKFTQTRGELSIKEATVFDWLISYCSGNWREPCVLLSVVHDRSGAFTGAIQLMLPPASILCGCAQSGAQGRFLQDNTDMLTKRAAP